jgi:hypothetical protein
MFICIFFEVVNHFYFLIFFLYFEMLRFAPCHRDQGHWPLALHCLDSLLLKFLSCSSFSSPSLHWLSHCYLQPILCNGCFQNVLCFQVPQAAQSQIIGPLSRWHLMIALPDMGSNVISAGLPCRSHCQNKSPHWI